MAKRIMLVALATLAGGCVASGDPPVKAGRPSADQSQPARYPVRTAGGYRFGPTRNVPDRCGIPEEYGKRGAPLTQAVVDSWPKRFYADIAVMQAALAGVAWPQEVAYIRNCIRATVTAPQVPGPMPGAAATPPSAAPVFSDQF